MIVLVENFKEFEEWMSILEGLSFKSLNSPVLLRLKSPYILNSNKKITNK